MRRFLTIFAGLIVAAASMSAYAVPVTINYTADNSTVIGGTCVDVNCASIISQSDFDTVFADGTEPTATEWRNADTAIIDLAPGTYGIAFIADNLIDGYGYNPQNPAGFLAEILWQGSSNLSSSAWDVTIDGVNWVSATEWYQNGSGVWGNNLLGEISSDANWIWDSTNFSDATTVRAGFRTSITVASVPDPATLALFGLGLAGIGFSRRKKA